MSTTKKLNGSTTTRRETASATNLLPVVNEATGAVEVIEYQKLKAQLRKDLLADKSVGSWNGNLIALTPCPNCTTLIAAGYVAAEKEGDTKSYFDGLCRWIADNLSGGTIISQVSPNGMGVLIFQSVGSVKNGYPRYASGIYIAYATPDAKIYKINCYDGVFSMKEL